MNVNNKKTFFDHEFKIVEVGHVVKSDLRLKVCFVVRCVVVHRHEKWSIHCVLVMLFCMQFIHDCE